ncbi:hypothetical protein FRE64_17130 (plasmid) [Euhalothece natronophila Z-M001]|uniref:Uncharacterized protein n=1 Tax=Euhalothece natronophila Z-M001 TaxID=522448 RepID=A0A5B8NTJ8_9CHRO|nr:hypothetical protein [Euhalothece natronophila]QDZ41664.1 hypothetical protein FRE64_16990 [Euhalothece natronophila Z-M001]QDZ41689.1 hypothetical protein FRE64_17130 [Euhalothece natronophila Z-M001]
MNNEMLNRFKNRSQRPTVRRNSSLEDNETPLASSSKETQNSESSKTKAEQIKQRLETYPKIAPRRNIRLEESLNEKIQQFCQEQDITIETFVEACFLACEQDSDLKNHITQEAQQRVAQRKEAGKLRRLYSQLEKLSQ